MVAFKISLCTLQKLNTKRITVLLVSLFRSIYRKISFRVNTITSNGTSTL